MKLYVEGGGDTALLKSACREGFSKFLGKAGLAGRMPRVVACGSRADAYDSFCTALRNGEPAMLLVDSEAPVLPAAQSGDASQRKDRDRWLPWFHLTQPQGDDWDRPAGSDDLQCHLMVQCMEAWLLADRETLKTFFGHGFREGDLPASGHPIEQIGKQQLYDALARASRDCRTKGSYGKADHSFKLLSQIDPGKVVNASPWAQRLVETLQARMSQR